MKRLIQLICVVALYLLILPRHLSSLAQAPVLPHAFYGEAEIRGIAAPLGSQVEARGQGVRTGVSGNPIAVTEAGKYGDAGAFAAKLVVQGDVVTGTLLEFYINGERAQCAEPGGLWRETYPFSSGTITNLNLRVGGGPTVTATPTATHMATASPTSSPTYTRTPTTGPTGAATLTRTLTPSVTPTGPTPTPSPTETLSPLEGTVVLQNGVSGYSGTEDTFLSEWDTPFPKNHGYAFELDINSGGNKRPLIRFQLPSLPQGAVVISATLSLRTVYQNVPRALLISVYQVKRHWSLYETTWDVARQGVPWGAKGCNSSDSDRFERPLDAKHILESNSWYDFDISEAVASWVADPTTNQGVLLIGDGSAVQLKFAAAEHWVVEYLPKLTIAYRVAAAPVTPTATPLPLPSPTTTPTPTKTAMQSPTTTSTMTKTVTPTAEATETAVTTPELVFLPLLLSPKLMPR